jgi:hypothetical protein
MELTPYLEALHRDLAAAAGTELLDTVIDSSGRLCLLEALSDAAAEITGKLPSGSVEVRLRGRDVQFVVTEAEPASQPAPPPGPAEPEGDITRITLRLPETLKDAVEAAAAIASISVNAWLVRAVTNAVAGSAGRPAKEQGRRYTGFAQA